MDAEFWHQRWQLGQIGFHSAEANPLLVQHLGALGLAAGARLFLPLCGKTRDIAWALSQGYRVVGAELSRLAVEQLFAELGVVAQISALGDLLRYQAPGLTVFVGDIFALSADLLGPVDAIYDRAALVALPAAMRPRYAAHLLALTQARAPQLLICFSYDQSLRSGPPFSVDADEVERLYGGAYRLDCLADQPAQAGLRGTPGSTAGGTSGGTDGGKSAREVVWTLTVRKA